MRILLLLFLLPAAFGQTFDVASVKAAAPTPAGQKIVAYMRGGPGTDDPGRFTASNIIFLNLLLKAYNKDPWEVSTPGWMSGQRYDVSAKIPAGTTKEQFQLMLQNLLAERFHLAVHREMKEMAAYELVVGKKGSKLKETDYKEDPSHAPPPPGPVKRDTDGHFVLDYPDLALMMQNKDGKPVGTMTAKAQPLSALVQRLAGQLRAPVVDKTGLTGKYDFILDFTPGRGAPDANGGEGAPPMEIAIQEQLGLKLESKKAPVEILVVDKADRIPTEN